MNCSSLKEVLLPDVENDYARLCVFSAAFCNYTSLLNMDFSKIELQDGCATFANCYSLKNIIGLKISSSRAIFTFYHCNNLEQLPNNISTFDFKDFAFAYCCNIEEVNINGLEVSYGCFYGCTNLKMIHFSGGQSIDIGEYSFAKCENLERLDLHKMQIIRIYNHAFSNCNSLKLLIMPKNERLPIEISETAFSHCNTNKLVLQWGIDGYIYSVEKYYQKEKKKNEEENKRTLSATKKFKQRFLDAISNLKKTSENDVRRNKIIGDFYDKEGEHLGSCICNSSFGFRNECEIVT